jgi:hypothetical protein
MRGLIFGTFFAYDHTTLELAVDWKRCHEVCNPGWPLALIDSTSYEAYRTGDDVLSDFAYMEIGAAIETGVRLASPKTIVNFADNVGHLAKGGRDGWGRAFCQGLQLAIDNEYDYVAHVEADLLSCVDWTKGIGLLEKQNRAVLAAFDPFHKCLETGLMLFRVPWLRKSDFIARYAWHLKKSSDAPEDDIVDLCKEQLLFMDIPGCRNDNDTLRPEDVDGMLYLTHCGQRELYARFMSRFGRRFA